MEKITATKTVHTISQFLDWQRTGTLNLNPVFQRRQVWKALAKSQLIDSVVQGYPIPIILLRQVQDYKSLKMRMEVVDGQQRIRTFLSYIQPSVLTDFDEKKDSFTVRKIHNEKISGKLFSQLDENMQHNLLNYELSTHVLPATTSDELVFKIFARLNSTGLPLRPQEIRNAEYHGYFKTLVYDLSFSHLDYWRGWKIFSDDAISRMDEAETVSECLMAMINGIEGKSQKRIDSFYDDHEEGLDHIEVLRKRFEITMDRIESSMGKIISGTAYTRTALFYSLFTAIYDHLFGLQSQLDSRRAQTLPKDISERLVSSSKSIRGEQLDTRVQDAMDKATGDKSRRLTRHTYIMRALSLESPL